MFKSNYVVVICLLGIIILVGLAISDVVREKIRRKKHTKWYELYNRALSNSLCIGSKLREMTETIDKRRKLVQETYIEGKCTEDEYNEASKVLDKEFKEAIRWFEFNKEALGIDADLRAADTYAKEHNLKWGIIYGSSV